MTKINKLILSALLVLAVFVSVKRKNKEPLPPVLSNVQKCIQFYEPDKAELSQNESIVQTMIQYGFKTVDELILESCIVQDKNGKVY